jgi:fatty acid desaturase
MLRRAADLRTLGFVGLYFFLSHVLWARVLPLPARVCLFLGVCALSFICATITHNAMHVPIFTARALNRGFQCALTLAYGHPVSTYVPGHNLSHHKFTQTQRDVMRTSKVNHSWHLLNGLLFHTRVSVDILRSDFRYMLLQRFLDRPIYRQALFELTVLTLSQALLLGACWRRFLLVVYVPHLFGQWGIVTMNLLQHDGCAVTEGTKGVFDINGARNFTGPLLNYFVLNNGFHTIHHMRPYVHWSELPAAHLTLVHPHIHEHLNQDNMALYIWRTFVYPGIRTKFDGTPMDTTSQCAGKEVCVCARVVKLQSLISSLG